MSHLLLHCPSCAAPVPSENVNINSLVAKCGQCNTIFSFVGQFPEAVAASGYAKPEVFMPVGIDVLRLLSELQIEISWRKTSNSFLLIFTIIWNAIVLPMAVVMIVTGSLEMLLFLSVHLSVGIGFLYATMANFMNTTYIRVSPRRLIIEHKPLRVPFYKNHDISTHEVQQLHAVRYEQGKTNGRPVFAFSLHATVKNGGDLKLLKGLKTLDQARYLEQEIERFLEITDKPVDGEFR